MSTMFKQSVGALRSAGVRPSSLAATRSATRYMPQLVSAACGVRNLSSETRAKIDEAVKSTPIVVFMKGTPQQPMCGFSRAVAIIMEVNNIKKDKFKSFNILEDQELRSAIKEYSEWPTIPQVYIDGEFVGGCDLMTQMHQSGELEKLLAKHDLISDVYEEDSKGNPVFW